MYRMAMLAMTMEPVAACDMSRVMRMCLVHDLAETRVGDITPYDGVSAADKHRQEVDAMTTVTFFLRPAAQQEVMQLFEEYERNETPDAKLTKDLDLFDMIQQAFEYEKQSFANKTPLPDLEEFFSHTARISDPQVQSWCTQLLSERRLLFSQLPN